MEKYFKGFVIFTSCLLLAELILSFLPIPLPSSIVAMLLLFALLLVKAVDYKDVDGISGLLLKIMPITFIPSAVGIMEEMDQIKGSIFKIAIIVVVSTLITMGVCGLFVQRILEKKDE